MWIKSLYLRHFRNYKEVVVHFGPELNFIQGKNAQGKTNLIEAIYFLSTGRSFRTERLQDLITDGERSFYIEVIFEKNGLDQRIKISFDGKTKRVETSQQTAHNFSSLLGLLPSVIATPNDIHLIMGAPQIRRRLLNIHIAQFDPLYVYHLSRYNKALKHRNALLKTKQLATIDIWEREMALSAAYLISSRLLHLRDLSHYANERLDQLSLNKETIQLKYDSTFQLKAPISAESLQKQMQTMRSKELLYGSTQAGPHRDELLIFHNDKLAKHYASEGQKQSLLSAIRFAERKILEDKHQTTPIFGIDDFGSHLDESRKKLLQKQLKTKGQTFLTTPDLNPQAEESFLIEGGSILKLSI